MNKLKKILFIIGIILLLLCLNITKVSAETDSIDSIDINVELNEDGTATITEVWKCSIYSGTEMYKVLYDLETSQIGNLQITDETGTKYIYLSDWDIEASRSEKSGNCGIYDSGDEIDICWGIKDYGSHIYTIKYTISKFVLQDDNYQLVYFTLVQDMMDPSPSYASITVSSDFKFNENNVLIAGYGYSGNAKIEDRKSYIFYKWKLRHN